MKRQFPILTCLKSTSISAEGISGYQRHAYPISTQRLGRRSLSSSACSSSASRRMNESSARNSIQFLKDTLARFAHQQARTLPHSRRWSDGQSEAWEWLPSCQAMGHREVIGLCDGYRTGRCEQQVSEYRKSRDETGEVVKLAGFAGNNIQWTTHLVFDTQGHIMPLSNSL